MYAEPGSMLSFQVSHALIGFAPGSCPPCEIQYILYIKNPAGRLGELCDQQVKVGVAQKTTRT